MNDEARKRLETLAAFNREIARDWRAAGLNPAETADAYDRAAADLEAALAEIDRLTKQWDSIPLVSSRYYELSLRAVGGIGQCEFGPGGFGGFK